MTKQVDSIDLNIVFGANPQTGFDYYGSDMSYHHRNGMILFKTGAQDQPANYSIGYINPFSKTLFKRAGSLPQYGLLGYDHDTNNAMWAKDLSYSTYHLYRLHIFSDAEENYTSEYYGITETVIYRPRFFFRANGLMYVGHNDGTLRVWNAGEANNDGTLRSTMNLPWGVDTDDMCYMGNNRMAFIKNGSDRKVSIYKISPDGNTISAEKSFSYPNTMGTLGRRLISSDGYYLYICAGNDTTGIYNIHKVDITFYPTILIINQSPSDLPADGQAIGIITARVLDNSGYPLSGITVNASLLETALAGSELLDTTAITDEFGRADFRYRAPTVIGTQNFKIEAIF